MLAALVPASLVTSREARGEEQTAAVQWIEDTLQHQRVAFADAADSADAAFRKLEAAKGERLAEVAKAEAALSDLKDALPPKKDAVAEATIALTASKKLHAEKQEEHAVVDADFLAKRKEVEGLTSALEKDFKAPLAAGEAVHFSALQPYVGALEIEESFKISIPTSCCKTKAQRGSFDELVLQSLEKSLVERLAQLNEMVASGSTGFREREAAVRTVEDQVATLQAAQQSAFDELSTAQKSVELGTNTLEDERKAVKGCEDELKVASRVREQLRHRLETFEQGPLAAFMAAKDRCAVSTTSATAGA